MDVRSCCRNQQSGEQENGTLLKKTKGLKTEFPPVSSFYSLSIFCNVSSDEIFVVIFITLF